MIEGLKQDSISLNKGIHRTPSLGADGELSECVNLIPKEGEIVALPEPKPILKQTRRYLCINEIQFCANARTQAGYEEAVQQGTTYSNLIILSDPAPVDIKLFYEENGEESYFTLPAGQQYYDTGGQDITSCQFATPTNTYDAIRFYTAEEADIDDAVRIAWWIDDNNKATLYALIEGEEDSRGYVWTEFPLDSVTVVEEVTFEGDEILQTVHKVEGLRNYITLYGSTIRVYKVDSENETQVSSFSLPESIGTLQKVVPFGNVLILVGDEDIMYYIWEGTAYAKLGSQVPDIKLHWRLQSHLDVKGYSLIEEWIKEVVAGIPEEILNTSDIPGTISPTAKQYYKWAQYKWGRTPSYTLVSTGSGWALNGVKDTYEVTDGTYYVLNSGAAFILGWSESVEGVSTGKHARINRQACGVLEIKNFVPGSFHSITTENILEQEGLTTVSSGDATTYYHNEAERMYDGPTMLLLYNAEGDSSHNTLKATQEILNSLYAAVNTFTKSVMDKKHKFIYPFYLRYAIELYDGSLINVSEPILMLPNTSNAPIVLYRPNAVFIDSFTAVAYSSDLQFSLDIDDVRQLQKWGDIVKGLVVSVSSPIIAMDTNTTMDPVESSEAKFRTYVTNNIEASNDPAAEKLRKCKSYGYFPLTNTDEVRTLHDEVLADFLPLKMIDSSSQKGFITMPQKREADIIDSYETAAANTYIIKRYTVEELEKLAFEGLQYNTVDLEGVNLSSESIVTKEKFEAGQYLFHRQAVRAKSYIDYNNRLCISDVYIKKYLPDDIGGQQGYTFAGGGRPIGVTESSRAYNLIVRHGIKGAVGYSSSGYDTSNISQAERIWLYTSLENVTGMWLAAVNTESGDIKIAEVPYKTHPYAGGYYWWAGLDTDNVLTFNSNLQSFPEEVRRHASLTTVNLQSVASGARENVALAVETLPPPPVLHLPRSVYQSEVDNPFVFKVNTQSTLPANILSLNTIDTALSQGQFGQFPLIAFTDEGVWALEEDTNGNLIAKQPLSRDVLSNERGVLQLDKALVFPTEQGLKLLQGSETASISDAVEGLNVDEAVFAIDSNLYVADTNDFRKQIQTAKMSYDYANGLIHVFTDDHNLGATRYKHYVYSLKTGEWATQILDEPLKAVVPTYPLTTLQLGNKLYQYDKSVDATDVRDGWLLTRPISMGNPVAHKMLNDLRVLGQKTALTSQFKVSVYISNDRKKWYRLRSLKGQSAKWYRFLVKTKMTDLDTLSGIVYQYVERYNGKMR